MLRAKVEPEARKALERAIKQAAAPKWYRRLKVIDLSAQGYSSPKIGQLFDLSAHTVRAYIKRYNRGGLNELQPNYGSGRRGKISLSKDELAEVLQRSPSQYEKLVTGARNWNQELMSQYLRHYHQLKISQGAISGTFKRLGLPWNRAKKKSLRLTPCMSSNDNGSKN
jgi:transposase